jgi:hypothetical protein
MVKLFVSISVVALVMFGAIPADASLITLSSAPALLGSVLIDFNSEADATFVSKTILGVTFTAGPAFGDQLQISVYTAGGDDGAGSGQVLSTNAGPDAFRIDFASPVSAFAMLWLGSNVDWNVNLFDPSNAPIEALVFANGGPNPNNRFYGAMNSNIKSVVLEAQGGFDFIKIDEFQFVSAASEPVPEPGTLILIGTGSAAIGALRRKRKSKA